MWRGKDTMFMDNLEKKTWLKGTNIKIDDIL